MEVLFFSGTFCYVIIALLNFLRVWKMRRQLVNWGTTGSRGGEIQGCKMGWTTIKILSKGMYDAGDLIKFGFPMAFTATLLSWSRLEYGDGWKAAKELENAQDSLKWITDYLINAHPSDNVLVTY